MIFNKGRAAFQSYLTDSIQTTDFLVLNALMKLATSKSPKGSINKDLQQLRGTETSKFCSCLSNASGTHNRS